MKKGNYLSVLCKRSILAMLFFFSFTIWAHSQETRHVTGVVTDAGTKETIPGVSVWIKETSVGATTDVNGKFSVAVKGTSGVMVFSFVGYESQEIPIGDKTVMNVALDTDKSTMLDEVVVIAYGQQKKESVIGAISTLSAEKLKTPAGKISNVLAGQLAGIIGMTRSGEPGAGSNFYIRGMSTFNSSSQTPLVLVDGIERSLDLVEPEDIATFSILKDATATAVYGVRGANGVLLITTRKGIEGKPKISVKFEAGLTGPTKMPKLVGSPEWTEMYNEAYAYSNDGKTFYSNEDIAKYRDGVDPDLYPNVNWIKELYKDWASNQNLNVNISGGGSMVRYYVAGSLYNEGSMYREDKDRTMDYNSSINFSRVNFRANLDINVTPSTIVSLNMANIYEKKNSPDGDPWYYSFATSPNAFPVKYSDGKLSGPSSGTGSNPYNLMNYSGYKENFWNTSQSVISLSQDFGKLITEGLRANIKFSFDAVTTNTIRRTFSPETWLAKGRDVNGELDFGTPSSEGQASLGFATTNGGTRVTYVEASINYSRLFAETHRIEALFLYNHKQRNNIVPASALTSLPYRTQGIAGRVTYAYKDRYFAEFNIGYNGSENFSPGKRFGVFPAGAVGWLVSNEKFWENMRSVVDVFKVKGSFGIVGDDNIGGSRRFIYEETMSGGYPYYGRYQFNASAPDLGKVQVGEVANPNVGWEEVTKTNIGIELGLFNSKIRVQADYFHENRTGIFLQRQSIPYYVGVTVNPYVNVGEMKNRGFDGSLEVYGQKIGQVTLTARANFTYATNTIVNNDAPNYSELYRDRKGQRNGQLFGYQALGYFRDQQEINNSPSQFGGALSPGDIKYKDINGDGLVNENDEIPIGYGTTPEIVYGFGFSLEWKNFDISAFFQGIGNVSLRVSGSSFTPFTLGNLAQASINEDVYKHRWNADNMENAKYPRLSSTSNSNNSRSSTLWIENASFIRLKTAEIGYTLPKKIIGKTFLTSVRVYASGLNLLTFSSFKLWDPERGGGQGNGYPPNRMISFGINIGL